MYIRGGGRTAGPRRERDRGVTGAWPSATQLQSIFGFELFFGERRKLLFSRLVNFVFLKTLGLYFRKLCSGLRAFLFLAVRGQMHAPFFVSSGVWTLASHETKPQRMPT